MKTSHRGSFETASGAIRYNMTNNYMFHVVLQQNDVALKGLIASLLHIDVHDIKSAEIQNPILIGSEPSSKDNILDILVLFNNNSYINLEMQVEDKKNWTSRSLSYLCREYDNLKHGDDYKQVKKAIHIGFLDYTLFPDHPEFYATYRMCNIKDGYRYSDNLTISVIELNHVAMATEEDRKYNIDKWAALFKATTWEEVKMIAQNETELIEAARSMYESNVSDDILRLCIKTQEEIDGDKHRRERLAQLDMEIAEKDREISDKDKQIASLIELLKANRIEIPDN